VALEEYGKIAGTFGKAVGCLSVAPATAVEVGLAGLLGSKALLTLHGGEPQAVAVGQTVDGVRVLSIQGDQATIEIEGKRRVLRVGQHAQGSTSEQGGGSKLVLHSDERGHFYATGTVNGGSIRFLVDTGATLISLGASDARRLGIDTRGGLVGYSETANGRARVVKVKLDTVKVGDIVLHNVDALVHDNDMRIALLGMSFLNRMEMQRDGLTMTLKKKY
jgi:aspartyl protease family protein